MSNYDVRYIVDGVSIVPEDVLCVTEGEYYTLTKEIPTKKRYRFVGWRCDADGRVYNAGERVYWNFESDAAFTAVWEEDYFSNYAIPEVLQKSEDFSIFTKLADEQFMGVESLIDNYHILIDPDKAPFDFVKLMARNLGWNISEAVSESFAREAIMRILDVYRERGRDEDIIRAATHGSNPGWLGGKLFDPQYEITNQKATIYYPKDHIFTHNKSKHSGADKFADGDRWMYGVIHIQVPYVDEYIREAIRKTIPAGVKYFIDLVNRFYGNKTYIEGFLEWNPDVNVVLGNTDVQEYQNWERTGRIIFGGENGRYSLSRIRKMWDSEGTDGAMSFGNYKVGADWLRIYNIEVRRVSEDTNVFDVGKRGKFSGRQTLMRTDTLEVCVPASYLAVGNSTDFVVPEDDAEAVEIPGGYTEEDVFSVSREFRGVPKRSGGTSGSGEISYKSGKLCSTNSSVRCLCYSGLRMGIIESEALDLVIPDSQIPVGEYSDDELGNAQTNYANGVREVVL